MLFATSFVHTKVDESKLFNRFRRVEARYGNSICEDEREQVQCRLSLAHKALQQFTNESFKSAETPKIGIVCSGGGLRAAVASLGVLQGLEKIDLLDGTTHIASLSGSTWSTASWMYQDYSLTELEQFFRKGMHQAFYPHKLEIDDIAYTVFSKITSGRPASLNDIYGGLLANVFLKTNNDPSGQNSYLSNLMEKISDGAFPIPIFTSIIGNEGQPYPWMEYTPFEVGSTYLQTWIPTWACGKKFKQGTSSDSRYEENFGFMLGVFGSAYAVSLHDLIEHLVPMISSKFNISLPKELFSWVEWFWFGNKRIAYPQIHNFSYKVDHSPLKKEKYLSLPDAGIDINIPFPPLFRRNMDVYIVADASGGVLESRTPMGLARQYAKNHDVEFPNFDPKELTTKRFHVIIDDYNDFAPVIIYLRNNYETSTFDFDYSDEEFSHVISNMRESVLDNVDKIKEAIRYAIRLKREGYRKIKRIKK